MDIDKIENILESLKFRTQSAEGLHHLLYNSLLTFNGILITAFSIIVAIKPSLYSQFIIPYFLLSFITIVGIVIIIYQIRQFFIDSTAEKLRELHEVAPNFFKTFPNKSKDNKKKSKYFNRHSRFIFILDRVVIILTLVNPIFIFIILYATSSK